MRAPERDDWVQWLVGFDVQAEPKRGPNPGDHAHDELAAPVEDILAGFVNAAPQTTAPQTIPLSQKQASPPSTTPPQKRSPTQTQAPAKPQPIVYTRTTQVDTSGQDKRKDKLPITAAKTPQALTKLVEGSAAGFPPRSLGKSIGSSRKPQ
jgi:hypothetical protein